MINAHPLHVRAGRLALIRLWMKWQGKLAPLLMRFPDSARILRARMITDIVSFCDSLVSRPAQKHVEALDELLGRYGASKPDPACVAGLDVITQFLSSYAFEKRAAELRNPRNKYGAHLEIADATSLIHILQSFDAADFEQGLDFFGVLEVVFENTCRATRFLVSHIVGDEPLAGFSSDFEGEQNEPFERGRPDIIIEERQNSFILEDEAALNESLEQWLLSAQEDARTVWWHAFLSSKIVERTEPDADRNHRSVELRRAHTVVFERLNRATHAEAIGIIKLFQGCKRGAPQPLVCLVLRYARSASRQLSVPELAVALGDLASWKDVEAREYVLAWAKNADNSRDRVLAARALGRLFVEAEYCDRFNEKRIGVDFEGEVLSVADRFEPLVRAIVLAVFASSFAWGDLSGAQEGGQFHSDYLGCCEKLRKECEVFAGRERLARAIEGGDFVAVCLLLREATNCDADAALCAWAAGSAVTCSPWPASWLNLALALSFSGQGARARALVAEVARRHPQSTEVLVDCVQTASQVIDGRPLVEELATNLDQNYDLTTAQKAVIAACRR